jgi:hypothetical protein|tara:strand:+ start:3869 stop:4381 length:513 start_codon:yes stop_codon:yes gene_type:complete
MSKRKTTGQPKQPSDFGTPEIGQRHTIRIEPAEKNLGRVRARVIDGNVLDKLFLANKIDNNQLNAGIKIGGDFAKAGTKGGWLSAMMGPTSKGGMAGGRFLFAATRISEAMDFVQKSSGRGAARVLIKTVTDEIDYLHLNQDKIAMLISALDSLSSYYESKASFPSSLRK